jgi:hypothetical protein
MAITDCHAQAMARVRMQPGRSVPLFREALLKGTLTRLRIRAEAMSRHTSLQRTEQKNSECHHPFLFVKIRITTRAGSDGKLTMKKSAFQRMLSLHAQNKTQKSGLTQAGTLTPSAVCRAAGWVS